MSHRNGTLYVVATPIGNLGDISPRAREVLAAVARVACEDTRRTGRLLKGLGIHARLISLHEHNEEQRIPGLLAELEAGHDIAVVSDAGTPLVSDPGFRLVSAVAAAGHRISPVPGPSAVLAALSVAGLPAQPFAFEGFPPRQSKARRERFAALASEARTLVLFEAVHRLPGMLADAAEVFGADRPACVARELTKLNEQILRAPLAELAEWAAATPEAGKGEAVVVIGPAAPQEAGAAIGEHRLLRALAARLAPGEAAAIAAEVTGQPKRELYRRILRMKETDA
jgi:16S rRNA (cytidine1402-2'-O)-methyltransferase